MPYIHVNKHLIFTSFFCESWAEVGEFGQALLQGAARVPALDVELSVHSRAVSASSISAPAAFQQALLTSPCTA